MGVGQPGAAVTAEMIHEASPLIQSSAKKQQPVRWPGRTDADSFGIALIEVFSKVAMRLGQWGKGPGPSPRWTTSSTLNR